MTKKRLPGVQDQSHDASTSLRKFPDVAVDILRHGHAAFLGLTGHGPRAISLTLARLLASLPATRQ